MDEDLVADRLTELRAKTKQLRIRRDELTLALDDEPNAPEPATLASIAGKHPAVSCVRWGCAVWAAYGGAWAVWVAALVAAMAIRSARAVIDALADPQTLCVFGVIAARMSRVGMSVSDGVGLTPYVTPFGLMRETSLLRGVVEAVAEWLKRAGLLEVLVDGGRGYASWRISETALAVASTGSDVLAR